MNAYVATTVNRIVRVVDTTIPTISLTGVTPQLIEIGSSYVELNATAQDNLDGNISANIVIDATAVNTAALGDYTVTYNVTDANSNAATTVNRIVRVVDTTIPTISLTGVTPQLIEIGSSYVELNATAQDNLDGDISANIVIDATAVNTAALGDYTVTYNVTDANSNIATTVSRTVSILAITAPTANVNFPSESGLTDGSFITVRGQASDNGGIANVQINGFNAISTNNYQDWSVNVPLTSGSNNLSLNVLDNFGNQLNTATVSSITADGTLFQLPVGVVLDSTNNRALVLEEVSRNLLEVNLTTGVRSIISESLVLFSSSSSSSSLVPSELVLDSSNNRVLAIDSTLNSLYEIDLSNGVRTTISDAST